VTAAVDDDPRSDRPVPEPVKPRPWSAPGPDARWWLGEAGGLGEAEAAPVVEEREPVEPEPEPAEVTAPARGRPAVRSRAARPIHQPQPVPRPRATRPTRDQRRLRAAPLSRRPALGLAALLLLALLATFFAWSSAEPLWLSLGHGTPGTATVADCRVRGIPQRCADFAAADGSFLAERVALLGTGPLPPGTTVPARMVSATGTAAYAGSALPRWVPDLLGVLLCGLGIAWLTGAYRLPGVRARLAALALSLAGPILLTVGLLAATW
jgi:hypothetical protein